MDKQLKNTKSAGSMILLMLFLFLLSFQSAWSAEDEAEILIFSLSPEKVEEQQGILKIQISTFSPIQQVTVKGKPRNFPKGASLVWLKIPYMLKPGINVFEVYVKTTLGEAKKIIRTIYETPELLKQAKLGDSFQLISILSGVTKDNIEKVEDNSSKSKAFSTSILFVPSYRFDLFDDSSIFLRGILMGDQQHNGKYEGKLAPLDDTEILLKQASIEWEERESWAGVLTLSLGTNEIGIRDVPESTSPRDSLSKKYKRLSSDNIYTLKAKQELGEGTTWNWQIDRKKKSKEGNNGESGNSTTLAAGYVTPIFGVKTTFGGTFEDTNLNGAYVNKDWIEKDAETIKAKLKVDYPIPPVSLGVQYDFSETKHKVTNPTLKCITTCNKKTKNRNQVYTLSLNYPAAAWCIFGLTQKHERQSSNIVGNNYKVNSTQLQVILIY
jgi:hypothetical protein